ncbi:enoyl-CoA hydratase/isomerase family protein [Roseovarius atlanticus]|uniref:enoyl-CoA hydratase/isomerase family protein n=1 Tax=Roseovarius atlanticus TaxID=1641875 RepID=UPI001C959130|nr:enoyl-CoA hydratase/isomerase family protein [Roseovarius atlanticus]MBY5987303.1 enoyl-CoA hydratase/isomerase family protein [Roseovarius atlanticus]MBY6125943.1 enoyl-CoA hydratase/isomerase family protein [Roseovarius atlanticus]MBY6149597.1 enoyl-CoA hydratase/isomerase family protein [Roseovarius atlanticus]
MTFETITIDRQGPVWLLTLNRPQRLNSMSQAMLGELKEACDRMEADPECRVVVVTGAGKAFTPGFDLQDQAANTPVGREAWQPVLQRDFDNVIRFWTLSKPTIAAVNGPALAGGCELAMACDITIAGESATFGEPEVKFGAGIVVMLLPWIVGPKKAKEIAFLGRDQLTAEEACEIGMVNQVVPDDEVLTTALAMARAVAVVDPMVMRRTKQQINETMEIAGMGRALDRSLEIDLELEAEGSDDKKAFLNELREGGLRGALAWRDRRFDV